MFSYNLHKLLGIFRFTDGSLSKGFDRAPDGGQGSFNFVRNVGYKIMAEIFEFFNLSYIIKDNNRTENISFARQNRAANTDITFLKDV